MLKFASKAQAERYFKLYGDEKRSEVGVSKLPEYVPNVRKTNRPGPTEPTKSTVIVETPRFDG